MILIIKKSQIAIELVNQILLATLVSTIHDWMAMCSHQALQDVSCDIDLYCLLAIVAYQR